MLTRDTTVIPRRHIQPIQVFRAFIIRTGPTDIHPVASAAFLEQCLKVVTLTFLKLNNPGQTTIVQCKALTAASLLGDQLHVLRILVRADPHLAVIIRTQPDPVLARLRCHQQTTHPGTVVVVRVVVETGRPPRVRPRHQL